MKRKQLFYLTVVCLSFSACRNEVDLLSADKAKITQQFSTFSRENSGKFDYAAAFKKLSLRHDQLHSRQFTGISPNGKSLIRAEHIAFGLHSKPLKDNDGNIFIIFPRVNSGKVMGLVAASVNKEGTKVRIADVKETIANALVYKRNISVFQAAEARRNPFGTSNFGVEDICGAQNPNIPSIDEVVPCDIDEIILPSPSHDHGSGGDGDGWGDWGDDPSDPDLGGQTGDCEQFMDCYGGGEDTQTTNDPCASVKSNINDAQFSKKVSELNTPTVLNYDHESGYASTYTSIGNQFQPMTNNINTHRLQLPDGDTYFGFIHTHINITGGIDIFSPADIMTFLTSCVSNAQLNGNISDAYCMVITSQGNYMLQFNGSASNLSNISGLLDNWNRSYGNIFQELADNDELSNQTLVETNFMKFLQSSVNINGLELYKVESNTSSKITLNSNNSLQTIPCP